MRHAYMAGTIIAIISGIIGVYVIGRNMSFLSHMLSEIGFSGASFGIFMSWPPLNGMLIFTIISSVLIGQMSSKSSRRESSISAISSLFLGSGILFLSLANKNASDATSILFGSMIGISSSEVKQIMWLSLAVLIVIFLVYRDLKFDSFDHVGAAVKGVNTQAISIIFLVILALSVSVAAQIVGSLMIFVLLTLPASSAKYFTRTVSGMMIFAIGAALIGVWLGLYLGYVTNLPVSFFIAIIECAIYFTALGWNRIKS
ncbi:ABC-type Mn2+ Zn2+ transport system, permease component [Pediococcus inopinatus]|nr:ABC-type Mn2+ Zn2+ transport system, permease component [Pediococcus inopinatus]